MRPFASPGERTELDIGALFCVEAGQIAELWITWDNLAALAQLRHFPPPAREG